MQRIRSFLLVILTLGLWITGCQAMGIFHRPVQAPPAPTALPASGALEISPRTPVDTSSASTELLTVPQGFQVSIFQSGLKGPRMMTLGPDGTLYVAERGADRIIRLPDQNGDGYADQVQVAADGLNDPSSLAFYKDGSLYVGETTRILRLTDPEGDGSFQDKETVISGLPAGGHSTRTVRFSPDGETLYVSIGSSCNICQEEDRRRAAIMRYRPDGSGAERYARGLRNAVGITFRPGTKELWVTNNGRDWLGDNQPPETVYHVQKGDDAGWPRCHAARIVDPKFGKRGDCQGVLEPQLEMQAHAAPLGLAFYSGDRFPEEYRGDLFIALHGSWNRTTPTGYKVVRASFENGKLGAPREFVSGWLRKDGSSWGRPVDVLSGPEGNLYISDDSGGTIYRVSYGEDNTD